MPVSPHLASRRVMLMLAAMAALDTMAVDLYAPTFPTLAQEFGVSASAVQATMSIFLIGAGVAQFLLGPMLDAYGRRLPIIIGAASFTLGSLVCSIAPNYQVFMVGRLIQSIGAAAAMVAPRAVITDIYEAKDIARTFSIIMQIMMIAPIISPVLGAFLLTHFGWRADFHLLTLSGGIVLLVLICLFPETLPKEHRQPLRPAQLLASYAKAIEGRRFFLLIIATGFVAGSLYSFLGASAFAFISGYGLAPITFSLLTGAITIAFVVVGNINIRLLNRYSELKLLTCGLYIQLAAAVILAAITYWAAPSLVVYIILSGITVAALGLIFSNVTAIAMSNAGPNAGIASAAMGISQSLVSASAGIVLGVFGANRFGMIAAIGTFSALALAALMAALRAPPSTNPT